VNGGGQNEEAVKDKSLCLDPGSASQSPFLPSSLLPPLSSAAIFRQNFLARRVIGERREKEDEKAAAAGGHFLCVIGTDVASPSLLRLRAPLALDMMR
jgi:hypothetical protein